MPLSRFPGLHGHPAFWNSQAKHLKFKQTRKPKDILGYILVATTDSSKELGLLIVLFADLITQSLSNDVMIRVVRFEAR